MAAKFNLGFVTATPTALAELTQADIIIAIRRHIQGDWGDLDEHDRLANERALKHGGRLFSVYNAADGTRFYVITEHDRSQTTVLLPQDY